MSLRLSITSDKDTVNLGETVTVSYSCAGAFGCTLQSDNMPAPMDFGTGDVAGTIKFLPVVSGDFNVTITAYGVVSQNKGIDNLSSAETNSRSVTVSVN